MAIVRHKGKERKEVQEVGTVITRSEAEIDSLVERAGGGDFGAFGELYTIYLERIYRYVFYQVRDKMTAEDLIEEIFVKAWKSIGSYRGRGQAFSQWLYRIAYHHVIDEFRKRRRHTQLEAETIAAITISGPEKESETELMRQEVQEALSCLCDSQRQVIVLKFIEGLDNKAIGQIMGKNQGAIRILQMRALNTLRQKLDREKLQWAQS